ncbi:MAG: Omp28-related outer membrane protein [Candidatus Cloacimonetes bacterium]|nr:Omp28-related outer membrane protein [Candidatus Cloacimonadota bacterium]
MTKKLGILLVVLALAVGLTALPRNLVVVEIGTGTWCVYCPGAAMGAHDLETNGHAVGIVKYHSGDSYNIPASTSRINYYGITGFPTAYFDGLNPSVGGSASSSLYNNYLPKVNARLAVPSKYTIAANGTMTGNLVNIDVTVAKPEEDTNTGVKLHAVVTESYIPQIWFNQTHVHNVTRAMVPSASGSDISLATGGQVTIPLSFTFQPGWQLGRMEVVFFLQNNSSKEILQAVKYSLPGLVNAPPVNVTALSFYNTYVTGSTYQTVMLSNYWNTPLTGTISFDNNIFSCPTSNYTIAPGQSQSLQVTFAPPAAGDFSGNMTITTSHPNYPSIVVPLSGTGFLNAPPAATNVMVSGPPVIYQDLIGVYTFSDPDGNTQGNSIIEWLRGMNNDFTPIAGQTTLTYRVLESDLGYQIAFRITPVDQHGMPGTPVMSPPTIPIETLPPPQNLTHQVIDQANVQLNWQRPEHFGGRGFVGYRVYRNELLVSTITNPSNTSFYDINLSPGIYNYWVCSLFNNPMMVSDPSNVVTAYVNVNNNDQVSPAIHSVTVYPNPFHTQTRFYLQGKANSPARINVFNLKGQTVFSTNALTDASGAFELIWNALDDNGNSLTNGVYFYRILSGDTDHSGRLVIVK